MKEQLKIREWVKIGKNVIIQLGTVIGEEGYRYRRDEKGVLHHHKHEFGVVIEDNVDIGANGVIDRGSWRDTVIGRGTKINNLVHIAHNVIIGRHCLVGAGAKICGSVNVEDFAEIWTGATIRDHINIGEGATVGMGAVVIKDVPPHTTVVGNPARTLIKND